MGIPYIINLYLNRQGVVMGKEDNGALPSSRIANSTIDAIFDGINNREADDRQDSGYQVDYDEMGNIHEKKDIAKQIAVQNRSAIENILAEKEFAKQLEDFPKENKESRGR